MSQLDATFMLGTFCEVHGPAIVLTSQSCSSDETSSYRFPPSFVTKSAYDIKQIASKFPSAESLHFYLDDNSNVHKDQIKLGDDGSNINVDDNYEILISETQQTTIESKIFDSASISVSAKPSNTTPTPSTPRKLFSNTTSCGGCSSLSEGSGLLSILESSTIPRRYFVTTHNPTPNCYSVARNACVRSLSCELLPGREGSVIFGISDSDSNDKNVNQWAIAYLFRLKDSKARGFTRWYSLLCLLSDYIVLINNIEFITKLFEKLVQDVQSKAQKIFEKDNHEANQLSSSLRSSSKMYGGLPRREGGGGSMRMLTDILGDKNFFVYMHSYFCWLQNCIEASFIEKPLGHLGKRVIINLDNCLLKTNNSGFSDDTLHSFHEMFKFLNSTVAKIMLYNILVGNQIVIRRDSESQQLVTSLLLLCQKILPKVCCKVIDNSIEYRASWECNFISMDISTEIPRDDTDAFSYLFLLDIKRNINGSTSDQLSLKYDCELVSGSIQSTTLGNSLEKLFQLGVSHDIELERLKLIKSEWKSLAKVFQTMSNQFESSKDPKLKKFLSLFNLNEGDVPILSFWKGGFRRYQL